MAGRFISTCQAHKALNSGANMGFSGSGETEGSKKSRKSPLALTLHEKEDCLYVQLYKRGLSLSRLPGLQASLRTAKREIRKGEKKAASLSR